MVAMRRGVTSRGGEWWVLHVRWTDWSELCAMWTTASLGPCEPRRVLGRARDSE